MPQGAPAGAWPAVRAAVPEAAGRGLAGGPPGAPWRAEPKQGERPTSANAIWLAPAGAESRTVESQVGRGRAGLGRLRPGSPRGPDRAGGRRPLRVLDGAREREASAEEGAGGRQDKRAYGKRPRPAAALSKPRDLAGFSIAAESWTKLQGRYSDQGACRFRSPFKAGLACRCGQYGRLAQAGAPATGPSRANRPPGSLQAVPVRTGNAPRAGAQPHLRDRGARASRGGGGGKIQASGRARPSSRFPHPASSSLPLPPPASPSLPRPPAQASRRRPAVPGGRMHGGGQWPDAARSRRQIPHQVRPGGTAAARCR